MFDDTLKHLSFVDNKILLTKEQLVSLFKQIHNEALIVAANNAKADVTILTEDGQYEMSSIQLGYDYEVYVIKNSILKYKL